MSVVQIDEFDESLRTRRMCAYLPNGSSNEITKYIRLIISNIQVGGEPFTRIICVTADPIYRLLADSIGANVICSARDNSDLSMILTMANQSSGGTLLILFPDIGRCPDAFFSKMPSGVTLLVMRPADDMNIAQGCSIHIMPYVKEIGSTEHSAVQRRLVGLGCAGTYDINAILKELRVAQAGLMIVLNKQLKHDLYWWNTADEIPLLKRKPDVVAGLLRFIADTL
jgi:hypothetical protein